MFLGEDSLAEAIHVVSTWIAFHKRKGGTPPVNHLQKLYYDESASFRLVGKPIFIKYSAALPPILR
jgi:hypothetical protein